MALSDDRKAAIEAYLGETGYTTNDLEAAYWADMLASGPQVPAANLASTVHAATSKTTPVDADELPIVDSAASNGLKKLTFANLWTWVKNKGEATATVSSSSGVVTIDLSADVKRYELTLTENVTSWTFTNPPVASSLFKEIIITVIQHASAAKTVVSPATTGRTAGGIAWVADTTLSSREALVLHCFSDSTRTLFPTGRQV